MDNNLNYAINILKNELIDLKLNQFTPRFELEQYEYNLRIKSIEICIKILKEKN